MKPSKAAMELAEILATKIWGGADITGENVVARTASLIDAHPMVKGLLKMAHDHGITWVPEEDYGGSNGLECLTCIESFDRGQEEHAEGCPLSNWQPQPEKED